MVIGLILSSAFSAIVVFAQELVPGRVGLIAGIFFGLAFGFIIFKFVGVSAIIYFMVKTALCHTRK